MSLIERKSPMEQVIDLAAGLGMDIKPTTKTSDGKVVGTKLNPKKNVKSRKVYKKQTKVSTIPEKAKPSKAKKSTIFGISFKSGGKIGTKKSKKQSGHNRLY